MTTEKAIEVLKSHKSHWERLLREKICDKTEGTDFINAVDMAIKALSAENMAEWIDLGFKDEEYGEFGKCSNCGVETLLGSNYCPNCGAKMKKESEEEE